MTNLIETFTMGSTSFPIAMQVLLMAFYATFNSIYIFKSYLCELCQSRMLLQPELVLEDVSQDHARKTVSCEYVIM